MTILAPRPLPQSIPPHFRLYEHYLYYQTSRHLTDHCDALRYAIQNLIDQGLFNLAAPSVTTNPLLAHSTHTVPPPASLHCFDYNNTGDSVYMMGWGSYEPDPITFDPYFEEVVKRRVSQTS